MTFSSKHYKYLEVIGLIGMMFVFYLLTLEKSEAMGLRGGILLFIFFCVFFATIGVIFTLRSFYRTGLVFNIIGGALPLLFLFIFAFFGPMNFITDIDMGYSISEAWKSLWDPSYGFLLLFLLPLLGNFLLLRHASKEKKAKDEQKTVDQIKK